jgi:putative redox protein
MLTSKIKYLGNLRTEAVHVRSGNKFITDAPVDNNGKGEFFSPSDTVATALGSCMLTIMGIAANTHGIHIDGTEVDIVKHMSPPPRKIAAIDAEIRFPAGNGYTEKEKQILEKAALTCPVALSLHPDIQQNVRFLF